MQQQRIHITAEWDEEASVWYVAECSIPGLVTEAPTTEGLLEKVVAMIADLVECEHDDDTCEVPIDLVAHRASVVHLAA